MKIVVAETFTLSEGKMHHRSATVEIDDDFDPEEIETITRACLTALREHATPDKAQTIEIPPLKLPDPPDS